MAKDSSQRRFLVIGLGDVGHSVALSLSDGGADVIAVDEDMHRVDEVKDRVAFAVQGDVEDPDVLRALEAQQADVAIVTIGKSFDATVCAVSALRDLGVKQIVARASNDRQRRVLEQLGASRVLSVEADAGRALALSLLAPHVLDVHQLAPGYDVVQWRVPPSLMGRSLAQIDFRKRFGLLVVAIGYQGQNRAEVPEPDRVLKAGDVLFVAGRHEHIARLADA